MKSTGIRKYRKSKSTRSTQSTCAICLKIQPTTVFPINEIPKTTSLINISVLKDSLIIGTEPDHPIPASTIAECYLLFYLHQIIKFIRILFKKIKKRYSISPKERTVSLENFEREELTSF